MFRPLNNWISHFFRVQKNELKRSLWAKIEEATLKSPGVLQRDDEVDQKITQCIEHHKREIDTQLAVQHDTTYKQITEEMTQSLVKLHRLREHREGVIDREGPKGEPIIFQLGERTHITYGSPDPRAQKDFERFRLSRIDADIEKEGSNLKQTNIKRERFFLPAKYNNSTEYKELLDKRTQAALAPTKLYGTL